MKSQQLSQPGDIAPFCTRLTASGETVPWPRWSTPRRIERPTRGPILVKVGRMLGWEFFPWQVDAADKAMEYQPGSGIPHYRTVGIGVARQNGKTTLVVSRIAAQLIIPKSVVGYTAQNRILAREKWEEHVDLLMATPFRERVARVDRANWREKLVMKNGSRYMPMTPNKKAARSLSLDLAIIDEARSHPSMAVVGAVQYTMMARPHAQLWVLSNAGDLDSKLWQHYTHVGRFEVDNPASSLCWIEYAADPDLEDSDIYSRDAWLDANPSLGLPGGVSEEALSDAALGATGDALNVFKIEALNIWIAGSDRATIDAIVWAACRSDLAPGERIALSLDITPERDRGALVSAGLVGELTPIEVLEAGSDVEHLITRTVEVAAKHNATVVIDRGSPAASAIPKLEKAGVNVRLIPLDGYKSACHDFFDAARSATLTHNGDYRLTDAVASAIKRTVGDGWVWKRRGGADITPLIAATEARWGVLNEPAPRVSAYDDENDLMVV